MKLPTFSKKILIVIGTIVLGAIGSGLWDAILKPFLPSFATFFLNIATLGLQESRNSLYVEIAKGTYERASLDTFNAVVSIFVAAAFITIASVSTKLLRIESKTSALSDANAACLKKSLFAGVMFLCLMTGYILIHAARMTYVVRAAAHMEQFEKIVYPYMTQTQSQFLESKVAQMSSRDDYEEIIDGLTLTARQHHLRIPEFNLY